MENAEACFYKSLGWLTDDGKIDKNVILQYFVNLKDAKIKDTFNKDVSECLSWNGNFGSTRTRRSADDEDIDEVCFLTRIIEQRLTF